MRLRFNLGHKKVSGWKKMSVVGGTIARDKERMTGAVVDKNNSSTLQRTVLPLPTSAGVAQIVYYASPEDFNNKEEDAPTNSRLTAMPQIKEGMLQDAIQRARAVALWDVCRNALATGRIEQLALERGFERRPSVTFWQLIRPMMYGAPGSSPLLQGEEPPSTAAGAATSQSASQSASQSSGHPLSGQRPSPTALPTVPTPSQTPTPASSTRAPSLLANFFRPNESDAVADSGARDAESSAPPSNSHAHATSGGGSTATERPAVPPLREAPKALEPLKPLEA